ncbi:MAG TPA: phospholipid carrier-dependent glycosyltransferase [Thermoanaerobaculia bacterium]|nr:phospholipid carrier-dependent glycosyltransferase [Thermoanaerobaculia bacterium]
MSEAPRPRRFGRRARTAALIFLAAAGFLAYARMLFWHASFVVGGSDSSGYANIAKLMTMGRVVADVEGLEQLDLPDIFRRVFIPLGFVGGPAPRTMAPYYPPGFPLHIAFAAMTGGWNYAPFLVSPLAALLCLLLLYLVAREMGLSRLFSAAGAAVLALFPTFIFQAEQPMSDVVAAMWTLAAVLFALKSRRRDAWAAAAGAAFGIAVLVRPVDFLAIFPLLLALRPRLRTLALFAAGGLPLAAFLLAWNRAAYGSALGSGYTLEGTLLFRVFPDRLVHYGKWLLALLSPLVPIGWIFVPADRRVLLRDRLLLVLWFLVFFFFYCFWDVDGSWTYTRYLLPGIPALILAALLTVRDGLAVARGGSGAWLRRGLAALALVVVLVSEQWWIVRLGVLGIAEGEKIYAEASHFAERNVPSGSFVVAMQMSGALRYYTGLLPVRWDWLQPQTAAILREHARARGRALYALVAPFEVDKFQERLPGAWSKIGAVGDVTLWKAQ